MAVEARRRWLAAALVLATLPGGLRAQGGKHLNPLVTLLEQKQAVFGLYAPANPRGRGGRGGAPAEPAPAQKSQADLAKDALAYAPADYIFDGSMEGDFDRGYATFSEFAAGYLAAPVAERMKHPLVVKMHEIGTDFDKATVNIGRQLNLGVSTVVLVGVESPDEVRAGVAAMRPKSKGGKRGDDVGGAPAFWGLSEKDYKAKADVWPLNKDGQLLNWTIVESKPGLERIREIAAVPGIGVLFPGAGTLGGVFSKIDSTVSPPRRVRDDAAWEAALQKVLDACNEFKVPCGFPANTPEVMEQRYKQGFRVFVIGWGENGFKTVEAGRAISGRN